MNSWTMTSAGRVIPAAVSNGSHVEVGRPRRVRRLVVSLMVVVGLLIGAGQAMAYSSGETVWSQTKTVNAGTTTLNNFTVSDNRSYDLNGVVTTTCSNTSQYWGFRVVEVKNLLPDPVIAKVNWDSPVKSCNAWGIRKSLSATATAYHYDVKVAVSGASFKAYVIAR